MPRTVERIRSPSGRALTRIVHGARGAGPVVAVTGNIHGDEITGLAAVQWLDDWLMDHLRRGTVVLFPSLNPDGLAAGRRTFPGDGVDLNRCFPGQARGTESERHAAFLWAQLHEHQPDCLIDLHADSATAIPYAILDRAVGADRRQMTERLQALGAASGVTLLQDYPEEEYLRFGLDHSLAGAMVNHAGVPAITIESGPRGVADPRAVGVSVAAVQRILCHLGLVDDAPPPDPTCQNGRAWRRASAPRARAKGVFVPHLGPGARFQAGDVLGTVRGVDGTVRDEVLAPAAGLVISWAPGAWVEVRGVTGTLGLEE